MSVGIGVIGREVTFTMGGVVVKGKTTKSLELTNSRGEVGDDNSNGWTEALANSLLKSGSMTIEGLVKNYELFAFYFDGSQIAPVVWSFPDGSTVTGDFFLDSISSGMSHVELASYSASLSSSGPLVFSAGT